MQAFCDFTANCFNAMFHLLPKVGRFMNITFITVAFVANIAWLWYMKSSEKKAATDF